MTEKKYLNEDKEPVMVSKSVVKSKVKPVRPFIQRLAFTFLFVAGVLAMLNYALESYVKWRSEFGLQKPLVFNYEFYLRDVIYKVEKPKYVYALAEMEEKKEEVKPGDPIEQKIIELWGERYFLIARSVFKCESGLRADAVNWESKDIGIAQINFPIWEKKIKEKFNYTLVDLFDPNKNLEVAYWIWDRANGKEGDKLGSFEPWVIFQKGSFTGCME